MRSGSAPRHTLRPLGPFQFLAYTKLEVLKLKVGLGHFRSKAQLYLAGLKAMQQELTRIAA